MRVLFALLVSLCAALPAQANSVLSETFVDPPPAAVEFCTTFPQSCSFVEESFAKKPTNDERMEQIKTVNDYVNSTVLLMTDQDLYGKEELWTYPEKFGDCEDLALLKRAILLQPRFGWSSRDLLLTIVFDEVGAGHAVLMARVGGEDYILDLVSKTSEILPRDETPYWYVKRQSQNFPKEWVLMGNVRPVMPNF